MELKTVLIVDDNEDIRNLFFYAMKGRYNVIGVENGKDALNKLSNRAIDIVILDVMLPDMSGLHILKYIKTFYSHIPVLMITGFGSENLAVNCLRLGARDYFKKPYSLREICKKVDILVKHKEIYKRREGRKKRENVFIILSKNLTYKPQEGNEDKYKEFTPHIKRAIRFIEKNFDKNDLHLDDVAREACLSKYYFSRIFKQVSGMSYAEFLNGVRITKAKERLKDKTASILDISLSVGYNNLSHFNRVFKKSEGISPGEYRRKLH